MENCFLNFLDKKTCETLVKMGCKSESEYYYDPDEDDYLMNAGSDEFYDRGNEIPAFCLDDFVGTHEDAIFNCQKVFGTMPNKMVIHPDKSIIRDWECARHAMIDSPDWCEYIRKALDEG